MSHSGCAGALTQRRGEIMERVMLTHEVDTESTGRRCLQLARQSTRGGCQFSCRPKPWREVDAGQIIIPVERGLEILEQVLEISGK